jgi:integrase
VLTPSSTQILTFLLTSDGKPFTAEGLTHRMRDWVREAGLTGCPLHGLRKAGARLAINAGCDPTEVAAIGGWRSVRELERYTAEYSREQAARRAGAKIKAATVGRTQAVQQTDTGE